MLSDQACRLEAEAPDIGADVHHDLACPHVRLQEAPDVRLVVVSRDDGLTEVGVGRADAHHISAEIHRDRVLHQGALADPSPELGR